MLKSLDAVKNRLHCNNLLSHLSRQQCVVANVCANVKHLSINTTLLGNSTWTVDYSESHIKKLRNKTLKGLLFLNFLSYLPQKNMYLTLSRSVNK